MTIRKSGARSVSRRTLAGSAGVLKHAPRHAKRLGV
jgi:hypothetical protein